MDSNLFGYLDIEDIINGSEKKSYSVNEKLDQIEPYHPDSIDLISLHNLLHLTSRTTVLEFGCGWSSLVFSASLKKLSEKIGSLDNYRRNNQFECHSVDIIQKYIDIAWNRIPTKIQKHCSITQSDVVMTNWNGRVSTEYVKLPLVNPDLIYLDAPDQFNIKGEINGWSTRHKDMMPMSCDILKIEHFLTPKTIIVVDGRAANARFIRCNLQRNWEYKYCPDRDQHFFVLEEKPLGKYSEKIIEEVYYRNSKWNISDL